MAYDDGQTSITGVPLVHLNEVLNITSDLIGPFNITFDCSVKSND